MIFADLAVYLNMSGESFEILDACRICISQARTVSYLGISAALRQLIFATSRTRIG
jgi:hypothetical protein